VAWAWPQAKVKAGNICFLQAETPVFCHVGYLMARNKLYIWFGLALSCGLAACSGLKGGGGFGGGSNNGGGGGGGSTTGSVAVTMVADTLPAHPSILSLRVSVTAISLTSSGSPQNLTLATPVNVDLMHLQTDTAFLGTFTKIPAASYTGVTLGLGATVHITFLNDTGATISGFSPACAANTICEASVVASGSPTASVTFTVTANGVTGVGLDLNLSNVVSITAGALSVSFGNANTLTAFTLPRTGSNLATGTLDLIEDFSGVASVSGNVLTVASPTRGSLSATAVTGTIFDADPSSTVCVNATTLAACVSNNQIVSMDAVLKSDGTLAIQEVEPLFATTEDVVEGTVISVPSTTQVTMVVTDELGKLAQGSLIGSLNLGDSLTVTLSSVNPFLVDTKGLPLATSFSTVLADFQGATDTTAIHAGQTLAIHVTSFSSTTTPASANTDTVMLRWSRLTATPIAPLTPSAFNITALPSYFNIAAGSQLQVQVFTGTQGSKGVTNVEGVADASQLSTAKPVAIRALYIENASLSANPPFFAGKVRQH
jgi:hypothetical protein